MCLFFSGCALIDKLAPSQIDESGAVIPGTHTATTLVKEVADAVPYGGVALSILLLITNGVEIVRSKKTTRGLMATIRTIEEAGDDPKMKEAVAELKILLAKSHSDWNVQPLINRLLSKLKFKV